MGIAGGSWCWLPPESHLYLFDWLLEDGWCLYFAGSEVDGELDKCVLCSGELDMSPRWMQKAFPCPASDRQPEKHVSKSTEAGCAARAQDNIR